MINELIDGIRKEQEALKDALVRFPNAEIYPLLAGKWQGLELAMNIVDDILRGKELED